MSNRCLIGVSGVRRCLGTGTVVITLVLPVLSFNGFNDHTSSYIVNQLQLCERRTYCSVKVNVLAHRSSVIVHPFTFCCTSVIIVIFPVQLSIYYRYARLMIFVRKVAHTNTVWYLPAKDMGVIRRKVSRKRIEIPGAINRPARKNQQPSHFKIPVHCRCR